MAQRPMEAPKKVQYWQDAGDPSEPLIVFIGWHKVSWAGMARGNDYTVLLEDGGVYARQCYVLPHRDFEPDERVAVYDYAERMTQIRARKVLGEREFRERYTLASAEDPTQMTSRMRKVRLD